MRAQKFLQELDDQFFGLSVIISPKKSVVDRPDYRCSDSSTEVLAGPVMYLTGATGAITAVQRYLYVMYSTMQVQQVL